jgi:hypothetical protein
MVNGEVQANATHDQPLRKDGKPMSDEERRNMELEDCLDQIGNFIEMMDRLLYSWDTRSHDQKDDFLRSLARAAQRERDTAQKLWDERLRNAAEN